MGQVSIFRIFIPLSPYLPWELLPPPKQLLPPPRLSSGAHHNSWPQWPKSDWRDRTSRGRWWPKRRWCAMIRPFWAHSGTIPPTCLESSIWRPTRTTRQTCRNWCSRSWDCGQIPDSRCSYQDMSRPRWHCHITRDEQLLQAKTNCWSSRWIGPRLGETDQWTRWIGTYTSPRALQGNSEYTSESELPYRSEGRVRRTLRERTLSKWSHLEDFSQIRWQLQRWFSGLWEGWAKRYRRLKHHLHTGTKFKELKKKKYWNHYIVMILIPIFTALASTFSRGRPKSTLSFLDLGSM